MSEGVSACHAARRAVAAAPLGRRTVIAVGLALSSATGGREVLAGSATATASAGAATTSAGAATTSAGAATASAGAATASAGAATA